MTHGLFFRKCAAWPLTAFGAVLAFVVLTCANQATVKLLAALPSKLTLLFVKLLLMDHAKELAARQKSLTLSVNELLVALIPTAPVTFKPHMVEL